MRGDLKAALGHLDRSLEQNVLNTRALNLKAAVLRHLGQTDQALAQTSAVAKVDPLDVRMLAEHCLADEQSQSRQELLSILQEFPAAGLETAVEYSNAGFWDDGSAVLMLMIAAAPDKAKVSPLAYYYLGFFIEKQGHDEKAMEYSRRILNVITWPVAFEGQDEKALELYRLGAKMPPDFVFPFHAEAIAVLPPGDGGQSRRCPGPYYLGNLLFDWQPEEAVKLWEKSVSLDDAMPIAAPEPGDRVLAPG